MKKNVWIINHYATNMFFDQGGRHHWFAKYLKKEGYNPTIFCANTVHNSDVIVEFDGLYKKDISEDIKYVFVKTTKTVSNGLDRIKNMVTFYLNVKRAARKIIKAEGKPDVILASSVHPLTLLAGIQIGKKYNIPVICEVRDLWPESFVAYGILSEKNPITKLLYNGEKWIYKQADSIVMTWEGGAEYITNKNWDNDIEHSKITHISNGIVLKEFDKNVTRNIYYDADLSNRNYKNIVYTGSIRRVNDLGVLIDAAKIIRDSGIDNIRLIVYGSGDQLESLIQKCEIENIDNVIFKGKVEKRFIPSILSQSYANILHNRSTTLDKYGQSQNKYFEYLAAGKIIIQTYSTGYNINNKYKCGINVERQQAQLIANNIIDVCNNENLAMEYGQNAREASHDFDFKKLTGRLIELIEATRKKEKKNDTGK